MKAIIKNEDGSVLHLVPPEGKTTEDVVNKIPEAELYDGPWPENATKFKWDDILGEVVEDTTLTQEEIDNQELADIYQERQAAKEASGLRGERLQKAYDYIDNKLDSAANASETKEAIRDILKKMVPFILE